MPCPLQTSPSLQDNSPLTYTPDCQLAESLMKQGFITKTEFRKIDVLLIAAFAPLIGKLIIVSLDKPED